MMIIILQNSSESIMSQSPPTLNQPDFSIIRKLVNVYIDFHINFDFVKNPILMILHTDFTCTLHATSVEQ